MQDSPRTTPAPVLGRHERTDARGHTEVVVVPRPSPRHCAGVMCQNHGVHTTRCSA